RVALARSVLYKFCMGLDAGATEYGFTPVHKLGFQYYTPLGDPLDPVGKPVKHLAADKQVSYAWSWSAPRPLHGGGMTARLLSQVRGCADYFDDIACSRNELYVDFVLSTQSTGSVVSMDFSRCRDIEGFVGEVTHEDCHGARS
ncbi:Alternative oxidase, mitochondrial precursor, partial [Perkinsus olseni]